VGLQLLGVAFVDAPKRNWSYRDCCMKYRKFVWYDTHSHSLKI